MRHIQGDNLPASVRLIPDWPSSCRGEGSIEVVRVGGKSAVTRIRANSPLKLLTPRGSTDVAWIVTSTYGGGLVGGDSIGITLHAAAGTRCILSTQAYTKVYRATDAGCRQELNASLEAGALLLHAPDPLVCYKGADFTQRQRFSLTADACLVMIDWLTSGRWAWGERWAFSHFQSQNEIFVDDRCVFRDNLLLDPADGAIAGPMRMGSMNCFATVVVVGPRLKEDVQRLLQFVEGEPAPGHGSLLFSASAIENGAVLRVGGLNAETVGSWIRHRLDFIVPLVGQDPWERKW